LPTLANYEQLSRLLSLNNGLAEAFVNEWAWNNNYLSYLNNLIGSLLKAQVKNLDAKIADVGDMEKFDSFVAELEVAELLCRNEKKIEFLSDKYLGKSASPDMISSGSPREAFVEVKMLRDEEVEGSIMKRLRRFLSVTDYIVSANLGPDISDPSKSLRQQSADRMMDEFERQFKSSPIAPPPKITTPYGVFYLMKKSDNGPGYPGMLGSSTITVPSQILRRRLAEDVMEKAAKRDGWDNDLKKYLYLVAIVSRQHWLDQDDAEHALIGGGTYFVPPLTPPKLAPSPEILQAQKSGWSEFLQEKCVMQNGNTVILPEHRGIYFTERACKNVSGVISMFRNWTVTITPNPFAESQINDARLTSYVQS
jgi:hypothetical protein